MLDGLACSIDIPPHPTWIQILCAQRIECIMTIRMISTTFIATYNQCLGHFVPCILESRVYYELLLEYYKPTV